jgi:hypothetical protein
MASHAKACPRCGSTNLTDNGGAEPKETGYGLVHLFEGIVHANPVKVMIGAGNLVMRVVNPLKHTCDKGHTF